MNYWHRLKRGWTLTLFCKVNEGSHKGPRVTQLYMRCPEQANLQRKKADCLGLGRGEGVGEGEE